VFSAVGSPDPASTNDAIPASPASQLITSPSQRRLARAHSGASGAIFMICRYSSRSDS
jgi:hypothetical protein